MKAGLWLITGGMLVIWTVGMAALAQLLPWLAAQLPQWVGALPPASSWPWPQWLSFWIDPALLQALQAMTVWLVELLRPLAPLLAGLGSVLGALVWLLWGLGALLALGLALAAHVWLSRRQRLRKGPA